MQWPGLGSGSVPALHQRIPGLISVLGSENFTKTKAPK